MARKAKPTDTLLWITQMVDGDNEAELARIGYRGDGARRVFEHMKRLPQVRTYPQTGEALVEGDVIVTLLVNGGDDAADDDPIRIPWEGADWLVGTFLAVPANWLARPLHAPSR